MTPRIQQDRRGGMAGMDNQGLFIPRHWRARTSPKVGDPASRQALPAPNETGTEPPPIYGKLTMFGLCCSAKGFRQGCTPGLFISPAYLCTLHPLPVTFHGQPTLNGWVSGYGRWGAG